MIQEFALVGYCLQIRPTPGRPFHDDVAVDGEQREGQLDGAWCRHDAGNSISRDEGEIDGSGRTGSIEKKSRFDGAKALV